MCEQIMICKVAIMASLKILSPGESAEIGQPVGVPRYKVGTFCIKVESVTAALACPV
jgi:hypothetical protein